MESSLIEHLSLLLLSLIANGFSALAGGGAGLLQLPVLIFLGLPFGVALATHKVASVALGLGATLRHLKEGGLQRTLSLVILGFGLPGVFIGANIILHIPDHTAQLALGILTCSLGIYSWLQKGFGQQIILAHRDIWGLLIGGVVLFIFGIINGSLTSGTGLFVTIWLIRWFGLDYKSAIAYTLILVGIFWNGAGAITLGFLGEIRWDWIPALLAGSLLGGYLGAHLALKHGNLLIKRLFELMTIGVGLKLIIG
jgi:uncharacterized protein